jgi:CYTH domain-containing protein/thymidylate kinase
MNVPRIVLTGGPCAGKTSALSRLRARLQTYGRRVYTTSEASTLMLDGGAYVVGTTPAQQKTYQRGVLTVTLAIEDALLGFARGAGEPAVLVCDRGAMDGRAYLGSPLWEELLSELGHDPARLRDGRYDAVVHLVTAADGAEKYYGNDNNPGRYEDVEGARSVDRRLRQAWSGHARHTIVDNRTDFDEKMRRVVAGVCAQVGIPGPGRFERKYLVRPGELPEAAQTLRIEQTYLRGEHEPRVRKCDVGGNCTYVHTIKKDAGDGRRVEVERPITLREYNAHLEEADPIRRPVVKRRSVYPHGGLYFLLDQFDEPHSGLWIMEAELDDPTQPIETPPFVVVEKEVTGAREFHNYHLARKPT